MGVRQMVFKGVNWINVAYDTGSLEGLFEQGDQPMGYIKYGKIICWLRDC
jgi:hypothetical protein